MPSRTDPSLAPPAPPEAARALYQALFHQLEIGFLLCDLVRDATGAPVDFRVLEANPAMDRLGWPRVGMVGRLSSEIAPEDHHRSLEALAQALAKPSESRRFERFSPVAGRWYALVPVPLDGDRFGILVDDITARRLAEQQREASEARQAFLLAFSDALRTPRDAPAMLQLACRLLGEHLGVDRVHIIEYREDEGLAIVGPDYAADPARSLEGRHALDEFAGLMQALRQDITLVFDDLATVPGIDDASRAACQARHVAAFVCTPMGREGRVDWALSVASATPRPWSADDVELVRECARRVRADLHRLRAESDLRDSEERFRTLASLVPALLWQTDATGSRASLNARWLQYTGQTLLQTQDGGWLEAIHPEDRAGTQRAFEAAFADRTPVEVQHRIRSADGDYRWFLVRQLPLRDAEGRVVQWFGAATDIHDQRTAMDQLEQRVAERTHALRQLLLRLETVQDDERRRLARELHDGFGQYLTTAVLSVGLIKGGVSDATTAARLEQLRSLLTIVDQELDRIVFELRPTALEDGGIAEGVAAHVATWSSLTETPADLVTRGLDNVRLPAPVEAAVFRVVQEALGNVARHARATRVGVTLERRRGQLVGSVEDDGVGFEVEGRQAAHAGRASWGLLSMQERIEALGGRFSVESRPGHGTTVLFRVSLPAASTAPATGTSAGA